MLKFLFYNIKIVTTVKKNPFNTMNITFVKVSQAGVGFKRKRWKEKLTTLISFPSFSCNFLFNFTKTINFYFENYFELL